MTSKKATEDEESSPKKLTLNKETVKDLDPKARGADVKAGVPPTVTADASGCGS